MSGSPIPREKDVESSNPKLLALKEEIQKSFNKGDFKTATDKSTEALDIIQTLPPQERIPETIQIHVNLSTACLHTNRPEDALKHADLSVVAAEEGVQFRQGHPQASEVLAITLNSKTVACIAANKLDDALEVANKSVDICNKIYPKDDPRLYKPLRTLSMVLDKRGEHSEAEKTLLRAYTIIAVSAAAGPQVPEAQMLMDDIVSMFVRKQDLEKAEKYAKSNYQNISDRKDLTERDLLILADSASRLSSILVKREKFADAEPIIERALKLREDSTITPRNPLGIAYSLTQLCGVRDVLNKLDNDSPTMLMRALDIFTRFKGPQSPEVMNTANQLQAVRGKLSRASQQEDDKEDHKGGANDNKVKKANTSSSSSSSSSSTNKSSSRISEEDKKRITSLPAGDGQARMMLANMYFEQAKYNCAEVLLSEGADIFLKTLGPEHAATKAARQNLAVVRNQRLNQIWMEVLSEEVTKIQELQLGK